MLALLRDGLPGVNVNSLIAADQPFPLVLPRRDPGFGWNGDLRFIDSAQVKVDVFCEDPDGDEDAAILSESVRIVLFNAWRNQTVVPGVGYICYLDMTSAPRRASGWNTAAGPVQYADLPTGVHRYEAKYDVRIRKPFSTP